MLIITLHDNKLDITVSRPSIFEYKPSQTLPNHSREIYTMVLIFLFAIFTESLGENVPRMGEENQISKRSKQTNPPSDHSVTTGIPLKLRYPYWRHESIKQSLIVKTITSFEHMLNMHCFLGFPKHWLIVQNINILILIH